MNPGHTLKSKLLRNLGANAYGQAITVLIQLLSVPLFLHYWGVGLYGEWLILSAIPAYLALSDIGFATVAANDMTMRVANGDRSGALAVYQSIWMFVSGVSIFVGISLAFLIYAIPVTTQFSIININETETRQVLLTLVTCVLLGLQGGVLSAAFRASGKYAYGAIVGNSIRLADLVLTMGALLLGGGVLIVASIMLATRIFGLLINFLILKKQVPWFNLGIKSASIQQVRLLLKPAIAFMAFPLGLALSLQGMVLIIGMTLGPSAVVIFSAYRTFTRLLVQVITMLNHTIWPEISAAFGSKKIELVRQLHRNSSNITFWIALISIGLLAFFGQWFIGIWTHHVFIQNNILFSLLLLSTFINVFWQSSWVVLMATNQHQLITIVFVVSAAVSLLFAYLILPVIGLNGTGLVILLAELPLLYFAINNALKLLHDTWFVYLKFVFNKPNLDSLKF